MVDVTGELRIERLVAGGEGLGHLADGRVIFVPGAFPGDLVKITSGKGKKKWGRAEEWTLLEESPDRVVSPCTWSDRCGGCDWMGYDLNAQRRAKGELVVDALRRTGRLEGVPDVVTVVSEGPDLGWRTRVRFHADRGRAIGFHARRTRRVIRIDSCAVADPRINAQLITLRKSRPAEGTITVQVEGDEIAVHRGNAPFVQANPYVNARLVADVVAGALSRVGESARFLELYAGAGNFTVPLGRAGLSGVSIEYQKRSVVRARAAAREAGLGEVLEITMGKVEVELPSLDAAPFDLVLLDPPRAGAKEAIEAVAVREPPWIGYVSCDPVTLARDLGVLQSMGYTLDSVTAYDMFPHTHHVETLAWMKRA
jgi:tRNA/tmRNA/rRNA uracil-C5-methylase (TrmA/RlmC/RlmD family)